MEDQRLELVRGAGLYKRPKRQSGPLTMADRTTTVELRNDTNGLFSCESRKYQAFSSHESRGGR